MKKSILSLGKTLSKSEQKSINGALVAQYCLPRGLFCNYLGDDSCCHGSRCFNGTCN